MTNADTNPITDVVVHMYKIGTGDCFVLKFMVEEKTTFKMMIDCGTWNRDFADILPFIETLKQDVENEVDVLVVTHEHKDHVLGFQAGEKLFTDDFNVGQIWMGWSEKDDDDKVKKWKEQYGDKKAALAVAAERLKAKEHVDTFEKQLEGSMFMEEIAEQRQRFADVLSDFAQLHATGGEEYKGSLKGMAVVKEKIADGNISFFKPGNVIENIQGLDGVRIYVLGPPELWEQVRQESGEEGEAYSHNKDLEESDLFVQALAADGNGQLENKLFPFEEAYELNLERYQDSKERERYEKHKELYGKEEEAWRRIDYDWLFSSGAFALRMNSLTNNLSLVLAFEFLPSGKVVLFPGDAEIGSWQTWHDIKWKDLGYDLKTEDLLNRVVFYKVAHHLSHNGTARSIGLDMMTHDALAAMATLDYSDISSGWTRTMPNRMIVRDLLEKTKGRLIILNEQGLHYDLEDQIPLVDKILEYRQKMSTAEKASFKAAFDDQSSDHYLEYVISL